MEKQIKLNKFELKTAEYIAGLRKSNNIQNHKMGHQVPHAELMGVSGEMAYCKMHNLYMDMTDERLPYDVIHGIHKLDIKCNDNIHRTMFINPSAVRDDIDGFAYMHTDDCETFTYMGKISVKRLKKDFVVKNCAHSPAYIVLEKHLIK